MAKATVYVISEGYVEDRVAGTVVYVDDGSSRIVIDPGMVADRSRILHPLAELDVDPASITDIILSHHHPDHTLNAALFLEAAVHDFQATYRNDEWTERESFVISENVTILPTPGHTPQDISTLIETEEGLVVATHLWWSVDGPEVDPYAVDATVLATSRALVLGLGASSIIPGHGRAFVPSELSS